MRLSIVIPAHNEERWIGAAIDAARSSADENGVSPVEIIVSDDASTDATARIAREKGALVVPSGRRNIGATRNIGAAAATGDILLFVDADTLVNAAALRASLRACDEGFVGGGAPFTMDAPLPFVPRLLVEAWNASSRLFAMPAGGYFFMKREAFERAGRFPEDVFVSEELWLGRALKRVGRVFVIRERVVTSARKFQAYSGRELFGLFLRTVRSPLGFIRDRKALDWWYERRDPPAPAAPGAETAAPGAGPATPGAEKRAR